MIWNLWGVVHLVAWLFEVAMVGAMAALGFKAIRGALHHLLPPRGAGGQGALPA